MPEVLLAEREVRQPLIAPHIPQSLEQGEPSVGSAFRLTQLTELTQGDRAHVAAGDFEIEVRRVGGLDEVECSVRPLKTFGPPALAHSQLGHVDEDVGSRVRIGILQSLDRFLERALCRVQAFVAKIEPGGFLPQGCSKLSFVQGQIQSVFDFRSRLLDFALKAVDTGQVKKQFGLPARPN